MTRETKVGLMMVALLVGVFGFLLYKRIHQPMEGLAKQESTELRGTDLEIPDGNEDSPRRLLEQGSELTENRRAKKSDPTAESKGRLDDTFAANIPETVNEFEQPDASRPKLKPPAVIPSDNDGFEEFAAQKSTGKSSSQVAAFEPAENAFDETFESKKNVSGRVTQVAAVSDSDPFSGENTESESAELETPFNESETSVSSLGVPDAIEDEASSAENSLEMPAFEEAVPLKLKEPGRTPRTGGHENLTENRSPRPHGGQSTQTKSVQQTSDFENSLEPAPRREERRPAPVTFNEKTFSLESSSRGTVSGPSYVIEPNDSFWTISRKRYGVGRYFKALARHNEQVVPDPSRMMPGVSISTPDVSVLEQRYADLIPKLPAADPAPAVVTTQSRKKENPGPSGFFVSADGVPMYRVTGRDTLSEIAKSHLGRSSRWVQILEMNRNILRDGNELKIGTVLRLPGDACQVQVVGTPREVR